MLQEILPLIIVSILEVAPRASNPFRQNGSFARITGRPASIPALTLFVSPEELAGAVSIIRLSLSLDENATLTILLASIGTFRHALMIQSRRPFANDDIAVRISVPFPQVVLCAPTNVLCLLLSRLLLVLLREAAIDVAIHHNKVFALANELGIPVGVACIVNVDRELAWWRALTRGVGERSTDAGDGGFIPSLEAIAVVRLVHETDTDHVYFVAEVQDDRLQDPDSRVWVVAFPELGLARRSTAVLVLVLRSGSGMEI